MFSVELTVKHFSCVATGLRVSFRGIGKSPLLVEEMEVQGSYSKALQERRVAAEGRE